MPPDAFVSVISISSLILPTIRYDMMQLAHRYHSHRQSPVLIIKGDLYYAAGATFQLSALQVMLQQFRNVAGCAKQKCREGSLRSVSNQAGWSGLQSLIGGG